MRIYIDISVMMLTTFMTGIQRATKEIVIRLISKKGDDIILLYYNAKEKEYFRVNNSLFCEFYLNGKGIKEKMISRVKVEMSSFNEHSLFFDLDAAWMSCVKRSWLLPQLKQRGVKIVAHIYDIISITHPQYCLERGVYNFMDYIGAHLQYADVVVTNAQATIDELNELAKTIEVTLPEYYVVHLGADFGNTKEILDKQVSNKLVELVKEAPYILMVGTIEPRKNHRLLLEAYDKGLQELGYNLIFAGSIGWNMEEFTKKLKKHPQYGIGIYHLSGLNDTEIGYLYQNAKFLAFCSYTEGYGLPLIEAAIRGTPVIAADIPVSREVAMENCVWFEQDNAEEIVSIIKKYDEDDMAYRELRDILNDVCYTSWEEASESIVRILDS